MKVPAKKVNEKNTHSQKSGKIFFIATWVTNEGEVFQTISEKSLEVPEISINMQKFFVN